MKKEKFWLVSYIILLIFSLSVQMRTSSAIDNSPIWQALDFDFNQPGARSRGIGGAFVGLADDASAAIANPAGLAQLNKIQIYTEGRFTDNDSSDESWGSGTEAHIQNDDITDFSYFALSVPLPISEGYTITATAFYNKLAHQEGKLRTDSFDFPIDYIQGNNRITGEDNFFDYTASNDLNIDEFGLGIASSFWKGKIMVGGSVSLVHLDLDNNFVGTNDGIIVNSVAVTESINTHGSDSKTAWHFGVLFRPTERLSIGLNGNIMPKIRYDTQYNNILTFTGFTFDGDDAIPQYDINSFEEGQTLNIPNSYSFGAAYRITNYWTVLVEGKYIGFSELDDDFQRNWHGGGVTFGENTGKYEIDNIWEPHLGTEYIFNLKETPIALRLGTYYEPSHSLDFDAPKDSNIYGAEVARAMENVLDGGDDVWHITVGTGVVLMNKLQLDVAADLSDDGNQNTFVASAVYQF